MPSSDRGTKTEWVESKTEIYRAYSNQVASLWTPNDLELTSGELTKIDEATAESPKTLIVEKRVAVRMSWTQAKLLNNMLTDIFGRFENLNGEVKVPQIPQPSSVQSS